MVSDECAWSCATCEEQNIVKGAKDGEDHGFEDETQVQIIAHRGASAEAPENSLEAFQLAIDMGCDWIECDVRVSKNGELVVIHDPVEDGAAPTLQQVLALDRKDVGLMIELKVDCVDQVLPLVTEEKRIVVGCLDPAVVSKIPRRLAIGIARTGDALATYREMGIERLAVSQELDYSGAWVWTVDGVEAARAAVANGATGIITNDPRPLLKAL